MYAELDRPRATIIKVALARSDEDDWHVVPRRMTNEDFTIIQCRIAADTVSTYSLHTIQYCDMRQYTSAQKDKWSFNRRDGSFIASGKYWGVATIPKGIAAMPPIAAIL